ncbi:MAG: disulfide oxidoreductase [Planctomycetes bacterium]|nr:disulfide oxidoreductase [Planctomycetota bacterium]
MTVTKDSNLLDVLENLEGGVNVFKEMNLKCWYCDAAAVESVGRAACLHPFDADALLAKLKTLCGKPDAQKEKSGF